MKKIFKIRHKATGLFYTPVKNVYGKNNLSKKGKAYSTHPSFEWVNTIYVLTGEEDKYGRPEHKYVVTQKKDWEIVEYKVVEDSIYNFT